MHWNFGHWYHELGYLSIPPRVQVIFWRGWRGFKVHRWTGKIGAILSVSIFIGWIELRFWHQPVLSVKVDYPECRDVDGGQESQQRTAVPSKP